MVKIIDWLGLVSPCLTGNLVFNFCVCGRDRYAPNASRLQSVEFNVWEALADSSNPHLTKLPNSSKVQRKAL